MAEEGVSMTRAEARAYFQEKGLTYADISRTDLSYLCALLDLHFVKERKKRVRAGDYPYWVRTNQARHYRGEWTETGAMVCAFLTGKGEYFTAREVVSFNRDGFIGFCGDAGDANAEPVLAAFVEWCDAMAEYKAMKKEDDYGG